MEVCGGRVVEEGMTYGLVGRNRVTQRKRRGRRTFDNEQVALLLWSDSYGQWAGVSSKVCEDGVTMC